MVDYFCATICPDEAFAQTVLLAEPKFRLCNDHRRFVRLGDGRDGHPRTLRLADGGALAASGKHFGRKVDAGVDAALLDFLDERLRPSP